MCINSQQTDRESINDRSGSSCKYSDYFWGHTDNILDYLYIDLAYMAKYADPLFGLTAKLYSPKHYKVLTETSDRIKSSST